MKNRKFRRVLALFLAIVYIFIFASCTRDAQNVSPNPDGTMGKLFKEPTDISIVIGSHASWPYEANWAFWRYFAEETGAVFSIQAIPNTEITTKVNLMMATPEQLPDLLHVISKTDIESHALSGAFVSIDDKLEKMPNFVAFFNTLPEQERDELMNQRRSGDGRIYFPPVYGTTTVNNLRTWMYRKDIFKKNNISVPTTMEDVYNVSKQLKEIYPNSYPLSFRTGLGQLDIMGPQWKNDFSLYLYYDFDAEKWNYGATEPEMKNMVEYLLKMYNEKLVPPDYLTINTKSWEELVSTDRGFMMPEYIVRIDFFNIPNRLNNPEYTWAVMAPPAANSDMGQAKIAKLNYDMTGYLICNTGNQERIDNAFKLLDWMYSGEGSELLSWGKEGETYNVVNGKKEFILKEGENPRAKYGAGTYGLYQRYDPAANEAIYTEEQREQGRVAYTYTEEHVNPTLWLPFNNEENKIKDELSDAIINHTDEQISKFLLGQRPISEWDAFIQELEDMGIQEYIKLYADVYERVMR